MASHDYVEGAGARYLPALGIEPIVGGHLSVEYDRRPGAPKVALLGYHLWERLFNADPGVIGEPLEIRGVPCTIVACCRKGSGDSPGGRSRGFR